jgi:DegV family protein with EDD domain
MEKIGLVTEAGADLPKEIIEENRIAVVPIKMFWPDLDGIPGTNTFQKMREAERSGIKSFGKTSQPSVKDFTDAFEKQLNNFEKVVAILLTSKLSGTFNSANQAKNFLKPEQQKRLFLIDSLSATAGEGLLVCQAIDLINENREAEEVVKKIEKYIPAIRSMAIIPDPKWLEAAGRMAPIIANWIRKGAKIGVRPLVGFKNGILASSGIVLGAKDIPAALFKKFEAEIKGKKETKRIKVVITHGDDTAGAGRLKEMIEKSSKNIEVAFVNIIDDVIGTLAGPDTIFLAWLEI